MAGSQRAGEVCGSEGPEGDVGGASAGAATEPTARVPDRGQSSNDLGTSFDPARFYRMEDVSHNSWMGVIHQTGFRMTIQWPRNSPPPTLEQLNAIFEHAFRQAVADAPPGASAQFIARNNAIRSGHVVSDICPAQDLGFDGVAQGIINALNSDESISLSDTRFYLVVHSEANAFVGGKSRMHRRSSIELDDWAKRKQSLCDPLAKRNRVCTLLNKFYDSK